MSKPHLKLEWLPHSCRPLPTSQVAFFINVSPGLHICGEEFAFFFNEMDTDTTFLCVIPVNNIKWKTSCFHFQTFIQYCQYSATAAHGAHPSVHPKRGFSPLFLLRSSPHFAHWQELFLSQVEGLRIEDMIGCTDCEPCWDKQYFTHLPTGSREICKIRGSSGVPKVLNRSPSTWLMFFEYWPQGVSL